MSGTDPSVAQQSKGLVRAAGVGMLAGVAGVAAMTASEKLEQMWTGRKNSYVPNQTLRRLIGAPSHQWRHWHTPADVATNHAMHWGQGAAVGAVRGVMTQAGQRGLLASARSPASGSPPTRHWRTRPASARHRGPGRAASSSPMSGTSPCTRW